MTTATARPPAWRGRRGRASPRRSRIAASAWRSSRSSASRSKRRWGGRHACRRRTRSMAGPFATSPPQPPLSALSRPAAADHCGFKPALWNPADPAKHSYKRSLCPQPPLPNPMWRLALRREATRSGELGRRLEDDLLEAAHARREGSCPRRPTLAADVARGWMVRCRRWKIGRSFFHTRYYVLDNKLLAYYKKQAKDNNLHEGGNQDTDAKPATRADTISISGHFFLWCIHLITPSVLIKDLDVVQATNTTRKEASGLLLTRRSRRHPERENMNIMMTHSWMYVRAIDQIK
ncbi:hypothetical protein ZWY2020_021679 [Hordeum vulgare]|nr:hypothetical protein ZWY2020_021679 [Hordeum vulgare]